VERSLFCKGLALNRSIKRLKLGLYSYRDLDYDALFKCLTPFFQDNRNLTAFEFTHRMDHWISASLVTALCECTSLKQITLFKVGHAGHEGVTQKVEHLVHALTSRLSLQQLCFDGDSIAENGSNHIKSMLSDPKCTIKSLVLNRTRYAANPLVIASGLNKNYSVQHISYDGRDPHLLLNLKSLNFTLRRLDLSQPSNSGVRTTDDDLAPALKNLCALESLNISHCKAKPETQSAIFKSVLRPISQLSELAANSCSELNDESLAVLGACIASNANFKSLGLCHNNATFKSLFLSYSKNVTSDGWKSFFSMLRGSNVQLENTFLYGNFIGDEGLAEFLPLLGEKSKSVNLGDSGISYSGWESLLRALHGTAVEKHQCVSSANTTRMPRDLHQLIINGQLKDLALFDRSLPLSHNVLSTLRCPTTRLEKLSFWCDVDSCEELSQTTSSWIAMLKSNTTLQEWHLISTLKIAFVLSPCGKNFSISCATKTP
jgi:hypothetical protein